MADDQQPSTWGAYPEPHYDEYDDCMCPDHSAMRAARAAPDLAAALKASLKATIEAIEKRKPADG